jgi:hypothetical protein
MSASWAGANVPLPAEESPGRLEVHIDEHIEEPAPVEPPVPDPSPPHKQPAPRVQRGSAHGLTAPGVAVVVLAASVVGAVIDTTIGDDLGPLFAVLFVASSVYAATQVRRTDLLAAVIVPPIVFLLVIGAHEILSPTGKSRALIDISGDLFSALALNAPTLWIGTLGAGAVVLVRYRRRR